MPLYIVIDSASFKPKFCVLFFKNKRIYFGLGHEGIHECLLSFKKKQCLISHQDGAVSPHQNICLCSKEIVDYNA